MLEIKEINTFYDKTHILHDISMEVKDCVAVVLGRNGMGKTTLIHCVIGFVPPLSGLIRYMDKDINGLPPYVIARLGIALVPQGRRIFNSLTVVENLTFASKRNKSSGIWSLEKIFSLFPVLEARQRQKANFLSGGEQQMLSIARALMTNPNLILMDEPSEGLAPLIVQEIQSVIMDLKGKGLSVLLVEQDIPFAVGVADYAYVIQNGTIVYESDIGAFIENQEVQQKYIGVVVDRSF